MVKQFYLVPPQPRTPVLVRRAVSPTYMIYIVDGRRRGEPAKKRFRGCEAARISYCYTVVIQRTVLIQRTTYKKLEDMLNNGVLPKMLLSRARPTMPPR